MYFATDINFSPFVFSVDYPTNYPPDDDTESYNMTDEQLLLSSIMRGYDRYTRPVFNASSTVRVQVGITLITIFDFVSSTHLSTYIFGV